MAGGHAKGDWWEKGHPWSLSLDRDRLIICGPSNGDLGSGGVCPLQDKPRL